MFSDAGGGANRRRRDLDPLLFVPCFLYMLLMVSASFQFLSSSSQPSRTLSLSKAFNSISKTSDGRRRCSPAIVIPTHPLLAPSSSKPSNSSDATLKAESFFIAQPSTFRSGLDSIFPAKYSHRTSLTARDLLLGPSDAPCPVESSTAHDDLFFWVETPWFSNRASPVTAFFSDHTSPARSSRNSGQPHSSSRWQSTLGKTLIVHLVSSLLMGFSISGPLSILPRPTKHSNGLVHSSVWPRSVYLFSFSSPSILMFLYVYENGRGLHTQFVVAPIDRLVKDRSLTLVEEHLSALESISNRFYLSKKSMVKSSSLIERTFDWSPTILFRNRMGILIIFLEVPFHKPVMPKAKNSFSTSLCLYWTVTIQQSPVVFVEFSSTHHSFACGKLLPCSCLRCMDLTSNYPNHLLYQSLVRVLVVIFVVSNHEVDVILNFVLLMV